MIRKSSKREQILGIFLTHELLTAHEVCERLPDVDRATIYRNIALFIEEGILRELKIKKGTSSYELARKNDFHQHFVCKICDNVAPVDIDVRKLEELLPKNMHVEDLELYVKGICTNCK